MERVLVDTGFLVALGRARDPLHPAASAYLETCTLQLATVTAVVEVPPEAYPELSRTMERYRERDIDFADAGLVWLAEQTGHRAILTVDDADFRHFRLKGRGQFELVGWR